MVDISWKCAHNQHRIFEEFFHIKFFLFSFCLLLASITWPTVTLSAVCACVFHLDLFCLLVALCCSCVWLSLACLILFLFFSLIYCLWDIFNSLPWYCIWKKPSVWFFLVLLEVEVELFIFLLSYNRCRIWQSKNYNEKNSWKPLDVFSKSEQFEESLESKKHLQVFFKQVMSTA